MQKNLRFVFIFFALAFFFAYLFLGSKPIAPAISLEPEWALNVAAFREENARQDGELIPYKLGQIMGYFTSGGSIASLVTFPNHAVISRFYQAEFLPNADKTDFFYNDGSLAGTIEKSGFPYFEEDRVFVFHPGGASFSAVNSDGSAAWTYEGYAPITAFSSSKGGAAAGGADGVIRVFAHNASPHEIIPGGSTYPVILGAAISADGKTVASVSGIEKQRFVVTKIENGVNKVLFHRYLSADTRSQTLVQFNAKGSAVYYGVQGALCVFEFARSRTKEIPLDGELLSVVETKNQSLVFALSKKDSKYTVWILQDMSKLAGAFSFEAEHAFIAVGENEDALYIGKNMFISKMNVMRK
jgi:hypothetical protein